MDTRKAYPTVRGGRFDPRPGAVSARAPDSLGSVSESEQHSWTVAVIGGGQLARMMSEAATALDIRLRALVEAPHGSSGLVIPDAPVGAARDRAAVGRVARGADVLTFEHEHQDGEFLRELAGRGVSVQPSADALTYAQDKLSMRRRLAEVGVECPRWAEVRTAEELTAFGDATGWPVVVKTPTGGYDGKGVRFARGAADVADWFDGVGPGGLGGSTRSGGALLAEEKVPFTRELAALLARRPSGEIRAWPVAQTIQKDGICSVAIAPAPDLDPALAGRAQDMAVRIAEALDVTGVLAVELFAVESEDRLVVNELAMRPHNSGHWTIDGAVTSQFEQHLRAVLDLPLGATTARAPWSVMVNLLGSELADPRDAYPRLMAEFPDVKVHLYGKDVRPGRKLGHVTAYGEDLDTVRARAEAAVALLEGAGSIGEARGMERDRSAGEEKR